jgi:hypothetical protein
MKNRKLIITSPDFSPGENVAENSDTPASCTICRKDLEKGDEFDFGGAPVCVMCTDSLKLKELDTSGTDNVLSKIVEEQGTKIIGEFAAISRSLPSDFGWNILALLDNITSDVEDAQAQALLESSMIICGLTAIRCGEGEGDVNPGFLSLFLVLGQVLDLSIMRRIVLDKSLRTSNKLDELKLIGEHNRVLFDLIMKTPHNEEAHKELLLASCLERVV